MPADRSDLSFTERHSWRAGVRLHYTRVALHEALGRLLVPEGLLVRWKYLERLGRPPNLAHPRTFTEKVQWRKLHGVCSRMRRLSDKLRVRGYVKAVVGANTLVPLVGVWETPEAIPFDRLPRAFGEMTFTPGAGFHAFEPPQTDLDWGRMWELP